MKMVGDLIFNRLEGLIKHKRTGEVLFKIAPRFAVQMFLKSYPSTHNIDSTGVKQGGGAFKFHKELVEHAVKVVFQAVCGTPTATDATVRVELYDLSAGEVVAYAEFVGEGGYKEVELDIDDLKARDKHNMWARFNVVTASATSGAQQVWNSALIIIYYDFTK